MCNCFPTRARIASLLVPLAMIAMANVKGTATILLLLAQGLTLVACGEKGTVVSPPFVAPSPNPGPAPANVGVLIKGAVYDTALRTLARTTIEVLDGPQAGTATTSDTDGRFSLAGTFDADTRFRATKEGHVVATRTFKHIVSTKWIFFEMEVLASSVNVAGDYTLTFIADSACADLPDEVRTRTYAATITRGSGTTIPADLYLNGMVTGASFLERYNGFAVHVAGDYVAIPQLGDLHGDPGLVEQIDTNTYLAFEGSAAASVGPAASTISMSLDGFIDYCVMKSAMGQRYSCNPSQAVAQARCTSANHRLILTRR